METKEETYIRQLESYGMTRSDAQACREAELREQKQTYTLKEYVDGHYYFDLSELVRFVKVVYPRLAKGSLTQAQWGKLAIMAEEAWF